MRNYSPRPVRFDDDADEADMRMGRVAVTILWRR
jgi:hypothetical protein